MPEEPHHSYDHRRGRSPRGGALPPGVVRELLEQVRICVEDEGWDAPFSVFGVRRLAPPAPAKPGTYAISLERIYEGSHPFADLPGLHLPDHFDGSILSCEGWERTPRSAGDTSGVTDWADPDPVSAETRMLTYLDRTGASACMLLRYRQRRESPEEIYSTTGPTGRVQDVFRRFVGLPVDHGDAEVTQVLGRVWLVAAGELAGTSPDLPTDVVLRSTDPLDAFVSPLRENLVAALYDTSLSIPDELRGEMEDPVRREAALRSFGLHLLGGLSWEDLRSSAGFLGSFLDAEIVEWCDAGMFAALLVDMFPPQHESLDRMVVSGVPALAESALAELVARSWNE